MAVKTISARSALLLACAGIALMVLSVPLYMALIDIPWSRSTAAPTFAMMALGTALAVLSAVYRPSWWTRTIAGVNAAAIIGAFFMFFFGAALPGASRSDLALAPDFTLPDEEGRAVSLAQTYAAGPVLLVFYRGHW